MSGKHDLVRPSASNKIDFEAVVRLGVNPFTLGHCVFTAKPVFQTVRVLAMKESLVFSDFIRASCWWNVP